MSEETTRQRVLSEYPSQGWMKREVSHVRRVQRLHDNATEVFDALVTLLRECDRPSDDGGEFDSACDYARSIIRRIEAQEGGAEVYCRDNAGETHAINPANNEFTLCGNAWEGEAQGDDWDNDAQAWQPVARGVVTCERCIQIIDGVRRLRVRRVAKEGEG